MDILRPDLKSRAHRRRLTYAALAVAALVLAGMALASLKPAAPSVDRASLWLDTVKRGQMLREVRGPGTLVPKSIRWIAADAPARVEHILVKPGAVVAADTVILRLANPEVIEQRLAADAALKAAEADFVARRMTLDSQLLDQRANLAGIGSDYESARLQAEAEKELADAGIIPRIQSLRSALTMQQLKLRMEIEEERIAKFRQTIDAQLAADRARIDQGHFDALARKPQRGLLRQLHHAPRGLAIYVPR